MDKQNNPATAENSTNAQIGFPQKNKQNFSENKQIKMHSQSNYGQTENLSNQSQNQTKIDQLNLDKLKSKTLNNFNKEIQEKIQKNTEKSGKKSATISSLLRTQIQQCHNNGATNENYSNHNDVPSQSVHQPTLQQKTTPKIQTKQVQPQLQMIGNDSLLRSLAMMLPQTSQRILNSGNINLNRSPDDTRLNKCQVKTSPQEISNNTSFNQHGVKLPPIIQATSQEQIFGITQNQLGHGQEMKNENLQFFNGNQGQQISHKLNVPVLNFEKGGVELIAMHSSLQQMQGLNQQVPLAQQFFPQSHSHFSKNSTHANEKCQAQQEFGCSNIGKVMNVIENPNIIPSQQMHQTNYIAQGFLPNTFPPGGLKGGNPSDDDDELSSQIVTESANPEGTHNNTEKIETDMRDDSHTVTSNNNSVDSSAFIEATPITMGYTGRHILNRSRSRSSSSDQKLGPINSYLNGKLLPKELRTKTLVPQYSQSSCSNQSKDIDCGQFKLNHHRDQQQRKRISNKQFKNQGNETELGSLQQYELQKPGLQIFKTDRLKTQQSLVNSNFMTENKMGITESCLNQIQTSKKAGNQTPAKPRILACVNDNELSSDKSQPFYRKTQKNATPESKAYGGLITNCFTVIKLKDSRHDFKDEEFRKPLENKKIKQDDGDDLNINSPSYDQSSAKGLSFLEQILIFKKLQSVGIFDQKTKEHYEVAKVSDLISPISAASLYQEMDFKVATSQSHVEKIKNMVRRKQKLNYLSYNTPFDLSELLDSKYWKTKNSYLADKSLDFRKEFERNQKQPSEIFEGKLIAPFLNFTEKSDSINYQVSGLYWQNDIDKIFPYQTGFMNHFWVYINKNVIINDNIKFYLQKAKRNCFCACTDGCSNSRKCSCYKFNRKLQNPTYNLEMCPNTGQTMVFQTRATTAINKVFSFNECHPMCGCNKNLCLNYLIYSENKKKFKFLVKRVTKQINPLYAAEAAQNKKQNNLQLQEDALNEAMSSKENQEKKTIHMWGLFAMEDIPAGAFLMEYKGEIVTKKQGDMRGTYYDQNGLSYLFDMNDPLPTEDRENAISRAYFNEFFPLCLDSMFYGNEARFINHSCDPNVQSFNLTGSADSLSYHNIGLFASRSINKGEELNLDYQWDKNELKIQQNVPCLCGSYKCRGYLMRARKPKKNSVSTLKQSQEYHLSALEKEKTNIKEELRIQNSNAFERENCSPSLPIETTNQGAFSCSDSSEEDQSVMISEESDLI